MFLAGLNSIGLNLNSRRLARRAEYMDVFCNPVSLVKINLINSTLNLSVLDSFLL